MARGLNWIYAFSSFSLRNKIDYNLDLQTSNKNPTFLMSNSLFFKKKTIKKTPASHKKNPPRISRLWNLHHGWRSIRLVRISLPLPHYQRCDHVSLWAARGGSCCCDHVGCGCCCGALGVKHRRRRRWPREQRVVVVMLVVILVVIAVVVAAAAGAVSVPCVDIHIRSRRLRLRRHHGARHALCCRAVCRSLLLHRANAAVDTTNQLAATLRAEERVRTVRFGRVVSAWRIKMKKKKMKKDVVWVDSLPFFFFFFVFENKSSLTRPSTWGESRFQ